jgi:hypothetical protein
MTKEKLNKKNNVLEKLDEVDKDLQNSIIKDMN